MLCMKSSNDHLLLHKPQSHLDHPCRELELALSCPVLDWKVLRINQFSKYLGRPTIAQAQAV